MFDLGDPALRDVLQTVGAADGETQQEDVRVGVGERPQPVVILLTWSTVSSLSL